jgi:heme/copper-type cytochrome/quinol oxidase subunit 2
MIRSFVAVPVLALLLAFGAAPALAQYATVEVVVKDKKFEPTELKAPANARIVIHVTNKDAVAMEFESKSLKVEKVVAANGEGIVRVGPLKPGKYDFFDDFNLSNRGTLVVE